MNELLNETHAEQLRTDFFSLFATPPKVELDPNPTAGEPLILIEGGGLSIGVRMEKAPLIGNEVPFYVLYGPEGDDIDADGRFLTIAALAVKTYTAELLRRVDDKIVTAAQAAEWEKEKTRWPSPKGPYHPDLY